VYQALGSQEHFQLVNSCDMIAFLRMHIGNSNQTTLV